MSLPELLNLYCFESHYTALPTAILNDDVEVVGALLVLEEGAPLDVRSWNGATALHIAQSLLQRPRITTAQQPFSSQPNGEI